MSTKKYKMQDTGWRRPIGCLKLQVMFRKRATNYRALLQKMTFKDKASYGLRHYAYNLPAYYRMPYLYRSFSAKEPYN